jgi:cob(I)alamin adenosyltransferase
MPLETRGEVSSINRFAALFLLYNVIRTGTGYNSSMSKFYTRKGDDGYTDLLGKGRIPKYHPRPEALGALDEANAALGLARAVCRADQSIAILLTVQRDLYSLMTEVSATTENASRFRGIDKDRVEWLEVQAEALNKLVEVPNEFIVPGDSPGGAALALARAIVRRAERQVAQLTHNQELENAELLRYLNRLSSLIFLLELLENQIAGKSKPTLAKA